ncbi:hypothetical protein ASF48_05105 [Rathayibacter sp. Leaf299]|uniref:PD-(D/E)XK nuclease-like domain-containing protein n=1 Tax=Rathayibacter sp. Leaf299 TaxID=1736328 RepID=UPI0006F4376F|nr:PD-(D/E)XK nuclease-like domain-containing protein [Rathayibacter sp. Leaf299]KQQ22564.1 hypothetical protein ASF48_05105 [Rathayibacter sp. Leaf299]
MTGRLVEDLDERAYHADPALSSTGAKQLLKAARVFDWVREHPRADTKAFDIGSAAHARILGAGAHYAVIPPELLGANGAASTKDAKEWMAQTRAAGLTPVKAAEAAQVEAMTEAVLAHDEARSILESPGKSELSAFAVEPVTGVDLRARFDRLPDDRTAIVDVKTTDDASRDGFQRTAAKYGYFLSEAFYGLVLSLIEGNAPRMSFVVVEKEPPYLVAVHSLADEFVEIGEAYVRRAIARFAACTEAGEWPGLPKADPIMPPMWLINEYMESRVA